MAPHRRLRWSFAARPARQLAAIAPAYGTARVAVLKRTSAATREGGRGLLRGADDDARSDSGERSDDVAKGHCGHSSMIQNLRTGDSYNSLVDTTDDCGSGEWRGQIT